MKLSVAMCTYNGEAYLQEQLNSILAQTRLPDEVVVCDDASTDASVSILRSFKEIAPFSVAIFVNEKNLRVCKNFEKAVSHCSGDIIALSDQDDIWLPEKLATLLDAFEKHPDCGYVFSNAELVDEHGKDIGRDLWRSIEFNKKQQARYAAGSQLDVMLRRFTLPYGMTMAFRAKYKSELMPFECRYPKATAHDTWISLLLSSVGAYGVAVPVSLVKYRQHPNQLASAGRPLGFVELMMIRRSDMTPLHVAFADYLMDLSSRLGKIKFQNESVSRAQRLLLAKSIHTKARVRANSNKGFNRIRIIFSEALSGRYRFSRSFKSILKDLISS